MADVSDPANPRDHHRGIRYRGQRQFPGTDHAVARRNLRDETVADQPGQSNISTFSTTDMPLALSQQSDVHLGRLDTLIYAMPMT